MKLSTSLNDCVDTVSYTHLDVYKRQANSLILLILLLTQNFSHFCGSESQVYH